MRRVAVPLALLALCAGLLAACAGGDGDGGVGVGSAGGGETAPQVVVETASPGFDPAQIFEEVSPGVVTIRSVFGDGTEIDGEGVPSGAAEGSGFVFSDQGEIVTNAHVVTDESSGGRDPAAEVFVEFPDRNVLEAEIVGFDPFADVALLEVDPGEHDLHPLDLGDDEKLRVGQPVAAIGSPFGEQQSLSVGVISAIDRSVKSLTEFQIEGAIQTDASINPGNSGGPLLDAGARVIGINQQIETSSGANDGVGFAVPISAIERSVAQLETDGRVEYAYIGVSSQALYPQLAEKLGLDTDFGGLVAKVVAGGPAEQAGIEGGGDTLIFQAGEYTTGGDVILEVEGEKVVEPDDLAQLVAAREPGETITLTVLRDGDRKQVEVTLGKRPTTVRAG
ncbi:MAG: trypsin-like peptidase domain-containing protein [Solirubrobacterales bacterium]